MRVFLAVIVLTLLAYAIGFVLFVSNLPVAPAEMPRADGIVVLTGGDERLETAVSMLEGGVAERLLVSGTALSVTKKTVGKISGGGPRFDCCADIGYAAEDTHGNAEEAALWAREHKFNSLILVTGRHHMPRTIKEFSARMPDITLIAYPVEQSGVALVQWWQRPRTAQFLHKEYFKYLASMVTTRLAGG